HCTALHDELRDVCAGLRAHAGMLAAPVVAVAGWQLGGSGIATSLKALFAGAKAQLALFASASTVVGVLGVIAGPWGPGGAEAVAIDDFNGKRGVELIITGTQPTKQSTPESIVLTTGMLSTAAVVPGRRTRPPGQGSTSPDAEGPPPNAPAGAEPVQPAT